MGTDKSSAESIRERLESIIMQNTVADLEIFVTYYAGHSYFCAAPLLHGCGTELRLRKWTRIYNLPYDNAIRADLLYHVDIH